MNAAEWERRLLAALATGAGGLFREARVLDECASTQDLAAEIARPGVVVATLRQTAGRGRLGRAWHHHTDLGLAVTLTLDASAFDAALLSLALGVAVAEAAEGAIGGAASGGSAVRLRWPNDAVAAPTAAEPSPDRKLAGVLVERRGGLLLAGVGVNVSHSPSDFPPELRARAASLAMFAATPPTREAVLERLIEAADRWAREPRARVIDAWRRRDTLIGTTRTFEHDGTRLTGVVLDLDPLANIVLRDVSGATRSLPALATSLVHEDR